MQHNAEPFSRHRTKLRRDDDRQVREPRERTKAGHNIDKRSMQWAWA